MDLNIIGSASQYAKNLGMQNKWDQKKKTGDFQSESKKTEMERKNDSFKAWYKEQQEKHENDDTLNKINDKLAAGAELSEAEMKYLKTKNPTLYEKVKNDKLEEKKYEHDLKHCKTKDEAERLKVNKVNGTLSKINSVKNDPNIPEGAKLSIAASEMAKLEKINRISAKFVKSGEYEKLPTEEEVHKVEKETREAKQQAVCDSAKASKMSEEAEANKKDDTKGSDENKIPDLIESRKTIFEAENSPEALKVKRSKAKKAYTEIKENTPQKDISVQMNFKTHNEFSLSQK